MDSCRQISAAPQARWPQRLAVGRRSRMARRPEQGGAGMKCPKIVWGAKDGDHLDLDAIRKPGQPSIDEILKAGQPKQSDPRAIIERSLRIANGIAESLLRLRPHQVAAKPALVAAMLRQYENILKAQRQIEIERHDRTIQDIDSQLNELKLLGDLI